MDFYKFLLDYYDQLFPFEELIFSFLDQRLPRKGALLDLGCATGTYASALKSPGRQVTGLDLEAGFIRKAEEKGKQVRWIVGDMDENLPGELFDGIFCIGNTLPHLPSREKVKGFLRRISGHLNPRGVLILQTVNFDRFDGTKKTRLPSLDAGGITFCRHYLPYKKGSVLFESSLEGIGTRTLPLLSLEKDEIISFLEELELQEIELFGSYEGDSWEPGSFLTILTARKR